jgi:hypothetical protein
MTWQHQRRALAAANRAAEGSPDMRWRGRAAFEALDPSRLLGW